MQHGIGIDQPHIVHHVEIGLEIEFVRGADDHQHALARRRREVSWALRQLGRSEASSAYDAKGQAHLLHTRKPLAVA